MAKEKDRSQRLHERHQIILADMLRLEENKYCADCNAKGMCVSFVKSYKTIYIYIYNIYIYIMYCIIITMFYRTALGIMEFGCVYLY